MEKLMLIGKTSEPHYSPLFAILKSIFFVQVIHSYEQNGCYVIYLVQMFNTTGTMQQMGTP